MRREFIAGNWKMNLDRGGAVMLAERLRESLTNLDDIEIAVFPPAVYIQDVGRVLAGSNIGVGAQNLHWENEGAFTGELSAGMLKEVGADYVIIGHSERRQYFGETDDTVNKKLKKALESGLKPIVCVGERLEERESGRTIEVVDRQVRAALHSITLEEMAEVTIAYEPVWAIGTGRTATPQQAGEVHSFIRKLISELYEGDIAQRTRIQYGGSVKAKNIKELMAVEEIDGALVGGASLSADEFTKIVRYRE